MENKKSGLATAGLVLGIVGISLSFIPILNNASFFLGVLSVIFGFIPFIKKKSKGKAIASIILGILSVVITISLQSSWADSLNDLSKDLDTMSGKNTEEVLKNIDVTFGQFESNVGDYGIVDTKLSVKVTNKYTEKKSFSITVEAVDSDGSRIESDTIFANDLLANQSQNFDVFTYVSDSKLEKMKTATFNVVEVSMY